MEVEAARIDHHAERLEREERGARVEHADHDLFPTRRRQGRDAQVDRIPVHRHAGAAVLHCRDGAYAPVFACPSPQYCSDVPANDSVYCGVDGRVLKEAFVQYQNAEYAAAPTTCGLYR